jgi:hypothetical protein
MIKSPHGLAAMMHASSGRTGSSIPSILIPRLARQSAKLHNVATANAKVEHQCERKRAFVPNL